MSALKRSASPDLIAKPSPYNHLVTLVEAAETSSSSNPRRSKRIRLTKDSSISSSWDEGIVVKEEPVPPTLEETAQPHTQKAASKRTRKAKTGATTAATKQASPRKVKLIPQSLAVPHPAPARWREVYDTIKEMRSHIVAPVDTMGCDRAQLKETDPKSQRFATLVSLMLSSQTKDEVTDAAVSALRSAVGGSLSVDAIMGADESTISQAICKVGFWRRKTQYIKQTAQRLHDDFDSDVPKTVDELCSLPGVGPKMAFLALQIAWKLNHGIGVDVHVHRITNRLGWHKPPTKTPEETRLNLQSWLPIELHPEINHMLVGFGQTVCLPVGPRCDVCELSSGLCPSAKKTLKTKTKRTKATVAQSGPKVEIAFETEDASIMDGKNSIRSESPMSELSSDT